MEKFILVIFSYLLGSILFGEIIARFKGVDLRQIGSGNVGATNVGRALGKKYAILVFLLDMLKGFIPVSMALSFYGIESAVVALTGIASVMGHMFSVFSRFRGGKGVATAFGVILAISTSVAFIAFLLWAVILGWKRYVSLASLCASVAVPVLFLFGGFSDHLVLMAIFTCALIIYKHRSNIDRLLKGEESRV